MSNLFNWDAEALQKKQAELTRIANGINKQLDSPLFTKKEQQTLTEAAKLLSSFKQKVTHAKEKKNREERQRKRQIDLSIKHAQRLLICITAALPIDQQIELAVRNDETCGWPYASYTEVLNVLQQHGTTALKKYLKQTHLDWIEHTARSMGWTAHSTFMPEPVTQENAQARINNAINGENGKRSTTTLQQILDMIEELDAIETAENVVKLGESQF